MGIICLLYFFFVSFIYYYHYSQKKYAFNQVRYIIPSTTINFRPKSMQYYLNLPSNFECSIQCAAFIFFIYIFFIVMFLSPHPLYFLLHNHQSSDRIQLLIYIFQNKFFLWGFFFRRNRQIWLSLKFFCHSPSNQNISFFFYNLVNLVLKTLKFLNSLRS